MNYKVNRDKLNKIANTWGSTGNMEMDFMRNKIDEISKRPEEIAKGEGFKAGIKEFGKHFLDPKTYRDWLHDTNTWTANTLAKVPGALPNMVGGLYGWAFDKPDNLLTRSGRWLDTNVGRPVVNAIPSFKAIDYMTADPQTRKSGFWHHVPDGQYSKALRDADPNNIMGFLEDMASSAVPAGGVGALARVPAIAKPLASTGNAVKGVYKAWKSTGDYVKNIAPNAFRQSQLANKLSPAVSKNIEKGLGIANKTTYNGLTWGAPAIDALHNFGSTHTRFDNNYAAPLATLGYTLKLTNPLQILLNATSSVPAVDRTLNDSGAFIYNKAVDPVVSKLSADAGTYVGDRIAEDIKEGKATSLKIPTYFKEYLDKSGPAGKVLLNGLVNIEEGQFNTNNIRKKLPAFARYTPTSYIVKGALNAAKDKAKDYADKFSHNMTGPLTQAGIKSITADFIDPNTKEFSLPYTLDKYKSTYPSFLDSRIADNINKTIEHFYPKSEVKVEPWHISASKAASLAAKHNYDIYRKNNQLEQQTMQE